MNLSSLLKNREIQNAGYLISGKMIQMVFTLIVGLLTARYLGPSNYGLINYANAYIACFAAICTLGIKSMLVKEFVDRPEDEGLIIGTTLGMRTISSIFSAILIVCISCFVDAGETTTIWVVTLCSVGMVFHSVDVFNYWFQARLESKVTASVMLCAYIVASAYKVLLLITKQSVVYFAMTAALEYICVGILLWRQYRKRNGKLLRFSWTYGKALLKRSYPFILSGLMVSIYGQTDKLMIKQMLGETEVGYYSTAVSLCTIWCFILSAIIESAYPSIMQAAKKNDENLFKKRNVQLYTIVFYISIAVSVFFTVFSKFVIGIMYGENYLPAATPLRIITWYTAFSYLGVARDAWVISKQCQKHLLKVYVAAALSNVMLNLLLIPKYGTAGAAFASLLAQIITTMVVPFFIRELRPNAMMMLEAMNPVRLVSTLRSIRGR